MVREGIKVGSLYTYVAKPQLISFGWVSWESGSGSIRCRRIGKPGFKGGIQALEE
jgi:hypothetical protein